MYRQNLAFQDLSEIPAEVREKYGHCTEELDLTHNTVSVVKLFSIIEVDLKDLLSGDIVQDLRFLIDFPNLTTLILDHNHVTSHVKIPKVPKLHTLWVNHNKIKNLGTFISTLSTSCQNLRYLSMMNNEAAPSYFNGGTYQQYMDYRCYVISCLPKLEVLDDKKIEENERSEAERIYPRKVRRESRRRQQIAEENKSQT